jgi:hypothetical protein
MMLKPLTLASVINSSRQLVLIGRGDLLTICRSLAQPIGLAALGLLLVLPFHALAEGPYQTTESFLEETFKGTPPPPDVVWLRGEIKETTAKILGHAYPGIRVRYWSEDNRTAWVLEEIGKTQPITVGLVVNENGLESIRVLAFRESRGWEVRYPFFTDQFHGIKLTDQHKLDRHIDGISGATLSVRALKKLSRLALYLHQQTVQKNDSVQ